MNLIAITGRIYAGKDETAKVIQQLTEVPDHRTIEDEFGNSLRDRYGNYEKRPNVNTYEIKKYAAKLKQIASILTGIPQEKFEDRDFKATNLGLEWDYIPVRKFLQLLGTDCVRFNLHENTWVNALFADYKPIGHTFTSAHDNYHQEHYPNWIITDCRFPNEYDAVKDRGGIVIRVTRGDDDTIDKTNLHASETSLDGFDFDWTINNTGDLHHLKNEVKLFLNHFHLLPY